MSLATDLTSLLTSLDALAIDKAHPAAAEIGGCYGAIKNLLPHEALSIRSAFWHLRSAIDQAKSRATSAGL